MGNTISQGLSPVGTADIICQELSLGKMADITRKVHFLVFMDDMRSRRAQQRWKREINEASTAEAPSFLTPTIG